MQKTMKKNILLLFAALCFGFLFQSCLKDQEDVFEDSPTVRMNQYLANAKKVLMSPANGWLLEYYPDGEQSYGGYNYIIKFNEETAEVGTEIAADLSETITSLYRLGSDTGPMLSFDTYNVFMDFFSTPTSSMYQAYGGDFEFMLLEVEADHVKLMGRRSGNVMYMYPLQEDNVSYLTKVAEMVEGFFISGMDGTIGGITTNVEIDASYQQLTFNYGDESKTVAYMYTPNGVKLYKPITIGTTTVSEMYFDGETLNITIPGTSDSIKGSVPEGWRSYASYLGDFWLYYNRTDEADTQYDSIPVTFSQDVKNTTLLMTGVNDNFGITWQYDRAKGTITWKYHSVATLEDGSTVRLCALDGATGGFTWATNTFGETEWNGDEANPVYLIIPQYAWSSGTRFSNSWYLCTWDSAGNRGSAPTAASGYRFVVNGSTSTSIRYLYSLAKR